MKTTNNSALFQGSLFSELVTAPQFHRTGWPAPCTGARADGKRRHSPDQTQGTGWLTGAGCLCRTCLHRCDLCAGCCAGAAFSRTPHCGRPKKRLAARSVRVVPQQHHCSLTPALWAARGPHFHMCQNLLSTLPTTAAVQWPEPTVLRGMCGECVNKRRIL